MVTATPIREVERHAAIWPVTITDSNGNSIEMTAELEELGADLLEGRFADFCYVQLQGFTAMPQGDDDDGMYVIWFAPVSE